MDARDRSWASCLSVVMGLAKYLGMQMSGRPRFCVLTDERCLARFFVSLFDGFAQRFLFYVERRKHFVEGRSHSLHDFFAPFQSS